jgi:hypothetical protein
MEQLWDELALPHPKYARLTPLQLLGEAALRRALED